MNETKFRIKFRYHLLEFAREIFISYREYLEIFF